VNEQNSGSVFAQWKRAAEMATGEFIWLCEADDAADPTFLARLMEAMAGAENPVLAFTDSRAVDGEGKQVMPSYQSYYFASGVKTLAASGIWEARRFAETALGVRNLIPNVSGVLWRREALLRALADVPDITKWRLAGDWVLYLAALAGDAQCTRITGNVIYIAEPLNTHRRHSGGLTQSLTPAAHVAEIAAAQKIVAKSMHFNPDQLARQAEYLQEVTRRMDRRKPKQVQMVVRKYNF